MSDATQPILKAEHLGITFGGLKAESNINMTINKGELIGLIGPNGAGKTTVFNLLTGVYKPTEGEFWLDGTRMNGKKTYQVVRAGIARTFQNIRLFKQLTVEENVLVAFDESFTYHMSSAIYRTPGFRKQEHELHDVAGSITCSLSSKCPAVAGHFYFFLRRLLIICRYSFLSYI